MRAFGYVHISGTDQVAGDGLVRQEEAISKYSAAHGITIERIFRDEGISGTLEARPARMEFFVFLDQNAHGNKTIVTEQCDRLARDLMVQEAIIDDRHGKSFNLSSVHDSFLPDSQRTKAQHNGISVCGLWWKETHGALFLNRGEDEG